MDAVDQVVLVEVVVPHKHHVHAVGLEDRRGHRDQVGIFAIGAVGRLVGRDDIPRARTGREIGGGEVPLCAALGVVDLRVQHEHVKVAVIEGVIPVGLAGRVGPLREGPGQRVPSFVVAHGIEERHLADEGLLVRHEELRVPTVAASLDSHGG